MRPWARSKGFGKHEVCVAKVGGLSSRWVLESTSFDVNTSNTAFWRIRGRPHGTLHSDKSTQLSWYQIGSSQKALNCIHFRSRASGDGMC